jgi:TatD family-associated radical SAM protein
VRNGKDSYYGNELWLEREPTAKEITDKLTDISKYNEIVFCGFGEPTYKMDVLTEIAKFVKSIGGKTRLNTNGQGNLINGYDITEKLKGVIDKVNVSLNEATAEKYQKICHSIYGENAYNELLNFAVKCKEKGVDVVLSIVDSIGKEDIEKCEILAKDNNLRLKVRKYIENS